MEDYPNNSCESTESFRKAMANSGLRYDGPIEADGKIHRFKPRGDKGRPGWYVLFPGPPMAGRFGSWKSGVDQTWCERSHERLSQAERDAINASIEESRKQREAEEQRRHEAAKRLAAHILRKSKLLRKHGYLDMKGVRVEAGLKAHKGMLVVPLSTVDQQASDASIHTPRRKGQEVSLWWLT